MKLLIHKFIEKTENNKIFNRVYKNVENSSYYILIFVSIVMSCLIVKMNGGCDGDFGRHQYNGQRILSEGTFVDGIGKLFPMTDLLQGLIIKIFNTGAAVQYAAFMFFLICIVLFYFIIKEYNKQFGFGLPVLPVLSFMAVHPVFIVAGGTVGDYIFSLVFILAAWLSVLKKELALGAVLIAIAGGLRVTNCFWLLPLLVISVRQVGLKRSLGFFVSSIIIMFLVWLGTLLRVEFKFWELLHTPDSDRQAFFDALKSAVSKVLGFVGFLTMFVTLTFVKRDSYKKLLNFIKNCPELLLVLVLVYGVFIYIPSELGYIISNLPVLAILIPRPNKKIFIFLQVFVVFLMNFIVFDIQNSIYSKLHLSLGYYVSEYTCESISTNLEWMRFSVPKQADGRFYYPIGDWAEPTRSRIEREALQKNNIKSPVLNESE